MPESRLYLGPVHVVSLPSFRNDFTLIQQYICLIQHGLSKLCCTLFHSILLFTIIQNIQWSHVLFSFHSHRNIWGDAHVPDRTFHYYHPDSKGLNFVALMDDVKVQYMILYLHFCSRKLVPYGTLQYCVLVKILLNVSTVKSAICFCFILFYGSYRMHQMVLSSYFTLVPITQLGLTLRMSSGEKSHLCSR